MPTDTIFMIAVVVTVFAVFMGTVAWAERTTRNLPGR